MPDFLHKQDLIVFLLENFSWPAKIPDFLYKQDQKVFLLENFLSGWIHKHGLKMLDREINR